MKLYQFPHSPYCIPISLILQKADIEHEEVLVPNWDRGIVSELTNGAYYQVPVIEDNGAIVYESSDNSLDVAEHVNRLIDYELFPVRIEGIHKVLIDYIESEIEGIGFKAVDPDYVLSIENVVERTDVIRHKERKFGRGCVDEWRANKEDLLSQFYSRIDSFKGSLTNNQFLFGNQPVYADYALYGVIENVHYIPANIRTEGREWLKNWMERLGQFKLV